MKWFEWVALAPLIVIASFGTVAIGVEMFRAMGWWVFLFVPACFLWMACALATYQHTNRSGWPHVPADPTDEVF